MLPSGPFVGVLVATSRSVESFLTVLSVALQKHSPRSVTMTCYLPPIHHGSTSCPLMMFVASMEYKPLYMHYTYLFSLCLVFMTFRKPTDSHDNIQHKLCASVARSMSISKEYTTFSPVEVLVSCRPTTVKREDRVPRVPRNWAGPKRHQSCALFSSWSKIPVLHPKKQLTGPEKLNPRLALPYPPDLFLPRPTYSESETSHKAICPFQVLSRHTGDLHRI